MTLSEEEWAAWLDRYKAAWEQRDPAMAGALFTADAVYAETPFDPPFEGRQAIESYWDRTVSGQKDVTFSYEPLGCRGDEGLSRWHAAFTAVPGGASVDLDGIFRCAFADSRTVRRLEEWWHVRVVPAEGSG